ncbi:hypothetical protein CTI12_AA361720 [Artemisia annua]|uniref:Reverse transcriptase domain-containing protein n=1 Tax=Artemisia annua TaxID=35608 RepID=A0A2U1M415_ARTAN|nr:hypothetical protein CTI12_AA361720 [Artemisia annua]
MIGIPRRITEHRLNVNVQDKPVAQKKTFSAEKNQAITKEVEERLRSGIIRPVRYPTWISNPVLVKKPDDTPQKQNFDYVPKWRNRKGTDNGNA